MTDGVVLTSPAFKELKRIVLQERAELASLRRRVAYSETTRRTVYTAPTATVCRVKNTSGATRNHGEVLEFSGSPITDFTSQPIVTGVSPTLVNGFGVLLEPIENNDFGPCVIKGGCIAEVNVSDADHRYAKVDSATYVLQSAAIGPARILAKPSGTGQKTCFILMNDAVGEVLVKNDTGSDIAVNSSGTFKIFGGTAGSEADTGQTISAYNKSSVTFKNGKFGSVSLLNGIAYAVPWQT